MTLLALGITLASFAAGPQAPSKKPARKSAAAAPATTPGDKSALNKEYLAGYIRRLYGWPAQVKVEVGDFSPAPVASLMQTTVHASSGPASDQLTFYVSSDGKYILNGSLYTAADNPFRNELNRITTALQPSFGAPGASVTLVLFSDYQCPFCRDEAKELRENITKTYPTQVRVYFKDYPLPNHDWARVAALAGRCIFRQNPLAFWEYHDWAFDKQPEINAGNFREKLAGFIKGKEIDPLQLNGCLDRRETEDEINKSIAEAKSVRVSSTPTMFLNGRRLSRVPWPNLKQVIDQEIEYQKTAKNAGEQECCEVKLPTLPGTRP